MYAFRKPFSVATFQDLTFLEIDYKIWLILSQVLGYMLSKFVGIKVISEMKKKQRVPYIIGLIAFAEIALILFAVIPQPFNIVCLFLNGFPLGMIWGIVFSYLEGRRFTEILGIALSSSFIVSSGFVKSVGKFTMDQWEVSEFWMPAVTGALFFPFLLLFAYLLEQIPKPTKEEEKLKSKRVRLSHKERKKIFLRFAFGLTALILFYIALTAFRDFRDNFSRELWDALGYEESAGIYTASEIPIAFGVLVILGLLGFIKSNIKALYTYHYLIFLGTLSIGISTWFFSKGQLSPVWWMIISGFGLYISYVPFNCIFFDRMIATFKIKGNSGFLIYLADSFGYLGSMAVLLYKNFGQPSLSWLNFFIKAALLLSVFGSAVIVVSFFYFKYKFYKSQKLQSEILAFNE